MAVAMFVVVAAGCGPARVIEPSPSPPDAAVLCADLRRFAEVVAVIPAIQTALQAGDQDRTRELAQVLRPELQPLIDVLAGPERLEGFDSRIDAVIGRLEDAAEHVDDYLTGRSPDNLGAGLDELESAESDYRSAAREFYPGVDCAAASADAP